MALNPTIENVTRRIVARSEASRGRYLERMAAASPTFTR